MGLTVRSSFFSQNRKWTNSACVIYVLYCTDGWWNPIFWVFDMDRTIEEELEVLYDAYYEELEQYANHQQLSGSRITPLPGPGPLPGSVALDSNGALVTGRHHTNHANNARMNRNGKLEYGEEYEEYDDFLKFGDLKAAGASFCHWRRLECTGVLTLV